MSDARDPRAGDQSAGGVSEEQARAYAEQLRSAPVEQLAVELLGTALNAAQAKLGRNDARLFIDLGGLLFDHARPYLGAELATQVEQVLGQLRLAQVQAESAPDRQAEEGDLPAGPMPSAEANGVATAAGPGQGAGADTTGGPARPGVTQPEATRAGATQPGAAQSGSATKLWLPGRDF